MMIGKGQKFQIKIQTKKLIGVIENSSQIVDLPIWVIPKLYNQFEALDDQEDGRVLIFKRKVVELENKKRVLANIYVSVRDIDLI